MSQKFLTLFNDAKLTNLEVSTSDHCPILLETQIIKLSVSPKSFRFENAWLRVSSCYTLVEDVWRNNPNSSFYEKLLHCSEVLSAWGKDITDNFKERISSSKKILKMLKGRRDTSSIEAARNEKKNLTEIYAQQEVFWRQRSKQLWLNEGDQNSKYFHATIKNRRKVNQNTTLKDDNGHTVQWGSGIEETMTDYFTRLFAATTTSWESITDSLSSKVTEEKNSMLSAEVEEKEIKVALFHMHPDKSPGPDGMSPGFYQKYWHIVKSDIISIVSQFFTSGIINPQLKHTNITLIPKKKNPIFMTDLRPISLCNVVYKIISKVFANRMKRVIDYIISDSQSAFIPGHLITDNILVAFEMMHFMKRKDKGKDSWMALKLDMSKAYDRVEWHFLEAVLTKLGFTERVIKLFMGCMTSVQYQILLGLYVY